jgi:AcrR family transcriptional regulator
LYRSRGIIHNPGAAPRGDGAPTKNGSTARPDGGVEMEFAMLEKRHPRKQVERREEAETKILTAAIRLLVDKGYDRFTLAEVGELAGYSRGLPAHYFGKKEDLLVEMMRYIIENYRSGVAKIDDVEAGLPHLIARIRTYTAGAGNRASRALGVLIAEAMFWPKLKRTISDLHSRGWKNWEDEIRAGVAAGNIRSDVNVAAQAAVIYAFLRGQMMFAGLDPKYDVQGTTDEFIATLTQRIAATPRKVKS